MKGPVYEIVVANLQSSVTQDDIIELIADAQAGLLCKVAACADRGGKVDRVRFSFVGFISAFVLIPLIFLQVVDCSKSLC